MILFKRGVLGLVVATGLGLAACGDPGESVPNDAPMEQFAPAEAGETEYEFNVIVLPNGTKETKTVTKPVPPKAQPPAYKPAPAPAPVRPAPAPAPRR